MVPANAFVPFSFHWYEGFNPPFTEDAVKEMVLPGHVGNTPDVRAIVADGVAIGSTVIVMELLVIVAGLAQLTSEVSVQVITSPFASVDEVNVVPVPTVVPPIFQSYTGLLPPLVMVDEKVTGSPAQMVVESELVMEMDGVTLGVTLSVMPVLVAVTGLAQVAFEITWQVTTGLPVSVLLVKVESVALDTGFPFTYHWYSGLEPPLIGVAVNVTEVF